MSYADVKLDQQGRFDVPGRFTREGGPEREGEASQPVRYSGKTAGRELTLEVVFESARGGPYALVLGRSSRLFKCNASRSAKAHWALPRRLVVSDAARGALARQASSDTR